MRYLTVICTLVLAAQVQAQEKPTNMGILTCTLVANEGKDKPLSCGFKPAATGREGKYTGAIKEGGSELKGKQILIWTVLGPAGVKVTPAALAQRFMSKDVDAAHLVGETNSSILLQPETNPGSQKGSGVTRIELQLVSDPV